MFRIMLMTIFLFPLSGISSGEAVEEGDIPNLVSVLPVFFVPQGVSAPTPDQASRLERHLQLAQRYYKQILKQQDTFTLAKEKPRVVRAKRNLYYYTSPSRKNDFDREILGEVFQEFTLNRFNCPFVFVIILMNPERNYPRGGGRPFNKGFNGGGGFVLISSYSLDRNPVFQGTLQHELGHSFGLVHVSSYGYDQRNNPSVMSYIKDPWIGFKATKNRGKFIPEDIRALSMNTKIFRKLRFDPKIDVPKGYKLARIVRLTTKEEIPGQKSYEIKVHTTSGEANGSSVSNIVLGLIEESKASVYRKAKGLNPKSMWLSNPSNKGLVDVELTFPIEVALNKICVHSGCGGNNYLARTIIIQAKVQNSYTDVCSQDLTGVDTYVSFEPHKAKNWRLHFGANPGGQVAIRGLRFYSPTTEIFCQLYPLYPWYPWR
jgi:hypothetical protein